MPDFPVSAGYERMPFPSLSTWSFASQATDGLYPLATAAAATAFPANNAGYFFPVIVDQVCTVYKMSIIVTTQSGNVDVGIYDENGAALVRAGATATAAAGIQVFDITDTTLRPGVYWLGMACSTTAAAFRAGVVAAASVLRPLGVTQMASAYSSGLVDPVTYATISAAFVPLITAHLVSTV